MKQGSFIKRAMVIGGGIAGISASIDIGNAGHEVVLVERLPSIGGRMLQLSETFPTLDCAQCTLTPKTVETGQHPRIKLLTYSEWIVSMARRETSRFGFEERQPMSTGRSVRVAASASRNVLRRILLNLTGVWGWGRRFILYLLRPFQTNL